jgi:hypothetical protein
MGKQTKPNISMRNLLGETDKFYKNFLGYTPEQTSLGQVPEVQWNEFTFQSGLNPNYSGVYLPRNQMAFIRGENPLSLFHEYFGHGLYCEQNLLGRKLVSLEKKLLDEEKKKFLNSKFTLEDLQNFRYQNQTFQELEKFKEENLGRYELFAIWTEYLLSGEYNLRENFERKYDSLQKQEKEVVDSIIDFSNEYGNLATMYAQGMARRTTPERVKKLLEDVYKEKLQDVKLSLLYGSKKEFSDIDVFMIGRNPKEFHSDFLDVRMQSFRDVKKGFRNFDVRIVVPIMGGEIIFGDRGYFENLRLNVLSQEIGEAAINHNLTWSFRMQRLREENSQDDFLRKKFEDYSKTYLANALALKEGRKLFTKEDLLSYSPSENKIELKGGTE